MRIRSGNTLALLVAMTLSLATWQAHAGTDTPTPTADTSAPGPQHARLAAIAGQWRVKQSFWIAGNATPQVDTGHATYVMLLGGRHLRQDLHIDSAGKAFDALGYLGYDNTTGKYFSTWMDINFTGVIVAHGDYDDATHSYGFNGAIPEAGGATIPMRAVLQVKDADHFAYDFYETRNGKEALAVRLDYTRDR
jgi:hypothetical protein